MTRRNPLGQRSDYPDCYAPGLLFPVARRDNREMLGLGSELPFRGEDIWNAWEITWLEAGGRPAVAAAILRVPAESPCIIESKSLKLYLGSLAMTHFESPEEVSRLVTADLSAVAGCTVDFAFSKPGAVELGVSTLPGICIDDVSTECHEWHVDPSLLQCTTGEPVEEALHSHLLRSVCPVTGQPDLGSISVRYRGPRIDRAALLRYLVSFREHEDFHENCVERIFVDLKLRCKPAELSVYARYTRRGGLDINPFRSDVASTAPNLRVWRQ